ncbi:hypothetical protein jhhlp_007794 [Lomentospora prolificans]|uniref:DUF4139 domain-containing protein n=1 Tax=Lomentospora prolificans TaxID=41688 RepID=A0A2N3N0L0_9PEZI|nr:hypothetical protein jhhlp_007794 [Lomentospora prolificans]
MDNVAKQEFNLRDLDTKSVTLFPSRAQIVREVKSLQLTPGLNEVTIVGLTPTLDEESIKVEGTGSATISDISVDLVANLASFEDFYPSDDDESDCSIDFDYSAKKPDFGYDDQLEALDDRETLLKDELEQAKEIVASAGRRLKILDAYGNSLDKKRNVVIQEGLATYLNERESVFADHQKGTSEIRRVEKQIKKLQDERLSVSKLETKARKQWDKDREKERKAAVKKADKQRAKRIDRQREKKRIKKERANFWPKYHYTVTVTLDASAYTPLSSRRSSISSEADVQLVKQKDAAAQETAAGGESSGGTSCDLAISYVTSSAFWAPSYDLQLSTTNNTANLSFEAKLTNATSETWRNAKIILSTSQTSFSGLEDALPSLVPWHVKLGNKSSGIYANDVLHSREERDEQVTWEVQRHKQQNIQKPRAELFGLWNDAKGGEAFGTVAAAPPASLVKNKVALAQQVQLQAAEQQLRNNYGGPGPSNNINLASLAPAVLKSSVPRAQAKKSRARLGSSSFAVSEEVKARSDRFSGGLFGSTAVGGSGGGDGGGGGGAESDAEEEDLDGDDKTILEATPELDFQDSAMEETGLTTTYDLPGLRTLTPRSRASKQRIARVNFSNIVFNHTVVAKYKPVAYLKAKLRNTSKLTLLRGPAGLTLDGSFMGRTRIPRCSSGDSFHLSLGIDPAIRVVYPKPEVRRSTTGMFSKEDSSIYTRTVTLTNTKAAAGKAATLYVLDQVPISEDERLRVAIHSPRGLVSGGSAVASGVPGREGADQKDWGKATALLRKENEISWEVNLKAGKSVKLTLEYEVSAPSGEFVVQC